MKEMKDVIETGSGTCEGCKNCGMGCTCGRMHGYHGHPVLRILLALAIVAFVFTAGVKLGELKAELGFGFEHGGYRGDMMMGRGQEFRIYEDQGTAPMPAQATTTVSVPATTTAAPATR